MTIDVVTLPEQVVIGIVCEGTWTDLPRIMPAAWTTLFASVSPSETFVGVSLAFVADVYTELVGYIADRDTAVPAGMTRIVIPARSYLHTVHNADLKKAPDTFLALENEARRLKRHSALKLDFGYKPGVAESPHDFYVGLEPEPAHV